MQYHIRIPEIVTPKSIVKLNGHYFSRVSLAYGFFPSLSSSRCLNPHRNSGKRPVFGRLKVAQQLPKEITAPGSAAGL